MPKRFLLIFLITFLIFIIGALSFIDKAYFLCPIDYKTRIIIRNDKFGNGDFAVRRSGGRRHAGIDLLAPVGREIKAVRLGKVNEARFHKNLGNYVELHHNGGLVTIYGHLSRLLVKEGQWVPQGSVIGLVGKSGNANNSKMEAHLHFELRKDNNSINPLGLLEKRGYPHD
ncbi:MAG: M23 family metallopeptidase [Candidatus Omnitrophica bacterium]|nr:M23 family metallopeptidase [Candidatus Omnitrophota bacterium]